jgi:hypothetical protein
MRSIFMVVLGAWFALAIMTGSVWPGNFELALA